MMLSEVKHGNSAVSGVRISADNQLLASASWNSIALVTRISDRVTLCEVKHKDAVTGVHISADNQLLATAS